MNQQPLTGKIVALHREREEDHRQDTLELWEQSTPANSPALPWSRLEQVKVDDLLAVTKGANSVAVSCSQQMPEVLKQLLARMSRQVKTRVYVYAPASNQDEEWLKALLSSPTGRILVRLGLEPPGDWLVTDAGAVGRLFLGAPGCARRWMLEPDAETARSLFVCFCWHFWNKATLEAIPGTEQAGFTRCLPSPFNASHPSHISLPRGILYDARHPSTYAIEPEIAVNPDVGFLPYRNCAVLLTPVGKTQFAQARSHAQRGTQVVWTDLELPRLLLSRQRLLIELEEGPSHLQLDFGAPDAIALMHALEEAARHPSWRFYASRRLEEVQGPVVLEQGGQVTSVDDRVDLDMGTLEADDLDGMGNLEPETWRKPGRPARSWHYRWQVQPPRAPKEAREARLIQEWRNLDEYVVSRGEALRRQLKVMEDEEASSGLLQRLKGLVKPWDAVKRRRQQIQEGLDEVLEDRVSRRPGEAAEVLRKLEEQAQAFRSLRQDARKTEEAEEIRLAKESQLEKFKAQQVVTKQRLDDLEGQLRQLQSEQTQHKTDKDRIGNELAGKEKTWQERVVAERQKRLEQSEGTRLELEKRREVLKNEAQQLQERMKSAKKDKKKALGRELAQKNEALSQLKKELGVLSAGSDVAQQVPEDVRRLRTQLNELDEKLKALEGRAISLERERDATSAQCQRPFEFKPPTLQKSPLKLEEPQRPPPIPKEALPERGRLLEVGSTRYLAVSTWEMAEQARRVAERLGAKRVAEPS